MDKINEFLKNNVNEIETPLGVYLRPTRRLFCKDGFSISVQASEFTYCSPRKDKAWPYSEVELGFPSEEDPLIESFAEDPDTIETVFPFVPIEIVNSLIEKHGGISED